jgi:ribosomal protein S18 acetylase RimI-like enzyme
VGAEEHPPLGRAAGAGDLDAVAASLASAFFEDPLWGGWVFPDAEHRGECLFRLMRFWAAAAATRFPWVRITDRAEAVAVWLPPGEPEITVEQEQPFESLIGELLGERAAELEALFELFEENHPEEPLHYYLSLWGTRRDHAGRGLGTALIGESLARIDGEGAHAYLESTNPANLSRYAALGFEPIGEFGPSGGPVITTMWREARRAR